MALLSTQTKLGSNIAATHYLAKAVATDKMISLPDSVVDAANAKYPGLGLKNNTKLSAQPSYLAQARAVMLSMTNEQYKTDPQYGTTKKSKGTQGSAVQEVAGDDQMAAAISVLRGVDENGAETDIDRVLAGHKVRSFFNNINDPSDSRYVTVDGFMAGIGMGQAAGDPYGAAAGKVGRVLTETPKLTAENANGGYAVFADGTRAAGAKIALEHNIPLLPDQAQAIAWIASGGGTTKGIAGIPVVIPRPQAATAQGEQLTLPEKSPATGDFTVVSSTKTDAYGNPITDHPYVGPTVLRDFVPQADAKAELDRRMKVRGVSSFLGEVQGVKASNGKIILSLTDPSMSPPLQGLVDGVPGKLTADDKELAKFIPTKEQTQEMLSTLADRYDHDDLGLPEAPIVYVLGPQRMVNEVGQDQAPTTMAFTGPTNPGLIKVNGVNIAYGHDKASSPGFESFTMPVATRNGVDSIQYTITHEYGHLTEFAHELYRVGDKQLPHLTVQIPDQLMAMMKGAPGVPTNSGPQLLKATFVKANKLAATLPPHAGISDYGKSNAHEAYAEAFTEWTLTGGKTDNKVAQLYAKVFNWDNPGKIEPGSNVSPIPGLAPIESMPGDILKYETPTKDNTV